MLSLNQNENVLLVLRKHWLVIIGPLTILILLLLAAPAAFILLPTVSETLDPSLESFIDFILALYALLLVLFIFLAWMDYYLDLWIITSQRIIDLEQKGLFNHRMAEIPLRHIQDVTVEIRGLIQTVLRFGTIRIQTAGEREFLIQFVTNLAQAKDLILKHSEKNQSIFS